MACPITLPPTSNLVTLLPTPPADGEDVAREHLHADVTPQLQKESSEQGASPTAGGAYGSRDDPSAQASQPTEGKSQKQIVQVSEELGLLPSQPVLPSVCWVRGLGLL
jgi:hypothetical protein